ncbi:hypothetical protein ADIARSV_0282 [Arcticibacter svalbardensis MN12-7]|uniref:DUF4325 domain-containing protein n=1 Tax=Arcticibacter svalbardensis MN12-7 TaxID=1150600 RepID=R9GXV1_9SPHI|nr:STAS-like domain-containing protein [Arcticibacter svalbardensis]EOR96498.1 hypothetical protein ADIARSV_0282 [Arcticibacter svalbardensis MN12-7]
MTISVLNDFTEYPGLRNCSISEFSGEEFYHDHLNNGFKESYDKKEKLIINLDGTGGYASSFLDEAFGNLVYDFTLNVVKSNIEIISDEEPHWKDMIEEKTFLQWEKRRQVEEKPIVTKNHEPWYRLVNQVPIKKQW